MCVFAFFFLNFFSFFFFFVTFVPSQSQRDMFLMVKNHVDFRSLAQALTVDRAKLKDYILVSSAEVQNHINETD